MNIQINNANLTYVVAQGGQTLPLNVILRADDGDYYTPRTDGSKGTYAGYKGYYVDLTGLYAQGYRKVRFKANKFTGTSGTVMGITCTSEVPTSRMGTDTVETVGSTANVGTVEWYELPITANTKCLHSMYTTAESETHPELVVWTPVDGDAEASTETIS